MERPVIARLIALSARHRLVVIVIVALATCAGVWSLRRTPLDAVPDLSDVQVTIFSEWMGRSPDLVEDQITYPIITTLVGAPHVTAVRGQSMFGMSFVNVIFEDGTDLYWARSRVLEAMSAIASKLPDRVAPVLGPDATGVGWVYEYALRDRTGKHGREELQSLQDWSLRYALQSVPGVAEVASVGGMARQYQIELDPNRLQSFHLSLMQVTEAVRRSNNDVGARVLEISGTEHFDPRARLPQERRRSREGGPRQRERHADHPGQRGARAHRSGAAARAGRSRRRRGDRRSGGDHALR